MKYKVWTTRALLIWVPVCLLLGLVPPIASVLLLVNGREIPWHVHLVNSLAPLATMFIVWRRHDLHVRIRDSIDRYLGAGTRLVIDVPYMTEAEIDAIDRGLVQAQLQCSKALGSNKPFTAHDRAFVIVRSEVLLHRGGEKVRVGGLTYVGAMLLEYTSDVKLLQDRARHEGCHHILNVMGRPDWTGDDHHNTYPELFK